MFVKNGELTYDQRFNMLNMVDRLLTFKKLEKLDVFVPDNAYFYMSYRLEHMHYDEILETLWDAFRYGEFGELEFLEAEDCAAASMELHDLSQLLSMTLSAEHQERLATLEAQFEDIDIPSELNKSYEKGVLTFYCGPEADVWHVVVEQIVEIVKQARTLLKEVEAFQ